MSLRSRSTPTERRATPRGGNAEPPRPELVAMILGTFREMPGLCLHPNQAARLFGLRPRTCQVLLEDLVAQGHLRRAHDGQYVGAERNPRTPPIRPPAAGRERDS